MIPGLIIDSDDADRVAERCWVLSKRGYPVATVRQKPIRQAVYLHHFLLGHPLSGMVVDHINGNRLDNRKSNLRVCRRGENMRNIKRKKNNTSGQAGVRRYGRHGRWLARIMIDRREIHLGCFDSYDAAVSARLAGELKYFGAFAPHICREASA